MSRLPAAEDILAIRRDQKESEGREDLWIWPLIWNVQ